MIFRKFIIFGELKEQKDNELSNISIPFHNKVKFSLLDIIFNIKLRFKFEFIN